MFHKYFLNLSLKKAIHDSDCDQIKRCAQLGANVNAVISQASVLQRAVRSFCFHVSKPKLNIVKTLLELGANPNYCMTPFGYYIPSYLFVLDRQNMLELVHKQFSYPRSANDMYLLMDCVLLMIDSGAKVTFDIVIQTYVYYLNSNTPERQSFFDTMLLNLLCHGQTTKHILWWPLLQIIYCLEKKEISLLFL